MEKEKVAQEEQLNQKELLLQIINEVQELKSIIYLCHGGHWSEVVTKE